MGAFAREKDPLQPKLVVVLVGPLLPHLGAGVKEPGKGGAGRPDASGKTFGPAH